MTTLLREAMKMASPIGRIPADYPYLKDLCRVACIGFEDVLVKVKTIDGTEMTIKSRRWFVVPEEGLATRTYKTTTGRSKKEEGQGKSANTHVKFCMILDYIEHRGEMAMRDAKITGNIDKTSILNVAIGKDDELKLPNGDRISMGMAVNQIRIRGWREINNTLAKMGVRGYELKRSGNELPDL